MFSGACTTNKCSNNPECCQVCGSAQIDIGASLSVGAGNSIIAEELRFMALGEAKVCYSRGPGCKVEGMSAGIRGTFNFTWSYTIATTKNEGYEDAANDKPSCYAVKGSSEMLQGV